MALFSPPQRKHKLLGFTAYTVKNYRSAGLLVCKPSLSVITFSWKSTGLAEVEVKSIGLGSKKQGRQNHRAPCPEDYYSCGVG